MSESHWQGVFSTKALESCSWYQERPVDSIQHFAAFDLPKDARLIDIGGGDSFLVDYWLSEGYTDITVLDISSNALDRAQARLGDAGQKVKWVAANVLDFQPEGHFDYWHDRAGYAATISKRHFTLVCIAMQNTLCRFGFVRLVHSRHIYTLFYLVPRLSQNPFEVDLTPHTQFLLPELACRFHFQTAEADIQRYVAVAAAALKPGAAMTVATFATNGPSKCSGLAISQYDEKTLSAVFGDAFMCIGTTRVEHVTPSGGVQHFVFGQFKKGE
jgi:hypothetical protein